MLTRDRRVAAACALAALATSGFAVLTSIAPHGWSTSVLVHMADSEPLARLASESSPNFRFVSAGAHSTASTSTRSPATRWRGARRTS